MNKTPRRARAALAALALTAFLGGAAAAQLGEILKGGGIALLVTQFGKDIDKALDRLTKTNMNSTQYATKVVPVLSAGDGTAVGAVQVMGPRAAVAKVQAVAQLEGDFNVIGGVRIRALVPIETKSVTNLRRVPGVGISGLLDFKL